MALSSMLEKLMGMQGFLEEEEDEQQTARILDATELMNHLNNPSKLARALRIKRPDSFYSSPKLVSKLNKVDLKEIQLNIRAENNYILLKCLGAGSEKYRIVVVAEDRYGDKAVCVVHNHSHMTRSKQGKDEFPVGTVFIIKEPSLTLCSNETQVLAIYSPTDIVRVTRNHDMFLEAVQLGWMDTSEDPTSASEWKLKGDGAFATGMYPQAIEAYLMGLKQETDADMRVKIQFNLSSSYFVTNCWESCLDMLSEVQKQQPEHEKALFQVGQCYYKLRDYESSLQYFQKVLRVNSSHSKVQKHIQLCESRLVEQNGSVDVNKLFDNKLDFAPQDFGSYIGPVEVVPVPGKGRGLIAQKDFKPGTLVLAEKALTAVLSEDSPERFGMIGFNCREIWIESVKAVHKNPRTFGKMFDLSCEVEIVQNVDDSGFVDVNRILGIITTNSFNLRSKSSGSKHSLLFHFCSYINHSCVPNCSMFTYNDVMLVRTLTKVEQGTEITIAYKVNLEPRVDELQITGFTCSCEYCALERRDSREVKQERSSLAAKGRTDFMDPNTVLHLVNCLEETYSGRTKYKTALFYPYLNLAKSRGHQYSEFMKYINKALNCIGLSAEDFLRCAKNDNEYFPKDAMLSDEDRIYEVLMNILWSQTRRQDQIKWFKVMLMFEHVFAGGDVRMLVKKYPDAESFTHLC